MFPFCFEGPQRFYLEEQMVEQANDLTDETAGGAQRENDCDPLSAGSCSPFVSGRIAIDNHGERRHPVP